MGDPQSTFQDLLKDHSTLRGEIGDLRQFLEGSRPEPGDEAYFTWLPSLAEKITRLYTGTAQHFRREEQSGVMADIRDQHPRAIAAVETLHRDHDRILADLRSILSAVMVYGKEEMPARPLRRWALSILDQLVEHEQEETDLFQELVYQELGGSG